MTHLLVKWPFNNAYREREYYNPRLQDLTTGNDNPRLAHVMTREDAIYAQEKMKLKQPEHGWYIYNIG